MFYKITTALLISLILTVGLVRMNESEDIVEDDRVTCMVMDDGWIYQCWSTQFECVDYNVNRANRHYLKDSYFKCVPYSSIK